MFAITISGDDGDTREVRIEGAQATIGRGREACVRLAGWRVGREHARIVRNGRQLHIEDLGQLLGTWVNGSRVARHGPLAFADEIVIGAWRLRVRDLLQADVSAAPDSRRGESGAAAASAPGSERDFAWRQHIHERLLETIDLRRRDLNRMSDDELRSETAALIGEIIDTCDDLPPDVNRERLGREVLDEAIGLGPLEALLADDSITEIMVNRCDQIFVERAGRIETHPARFTSDRTVLGVIERIVAPLGRRIDESSPMVDARLKDGSRVNAIIAPLALKGPALTIRKFARKHLHMADLLARESLSPAMAEFLRVCVEQRRSIVVSGGTGSGKTTFLNLLSQFIPAHERIITIEDAAELRLTHDNLVALEARPGNVEGRGSVSIRELVRNALRMRPDRIVVGECRGGEALDMLQAMNTGHAGSLTTVHANSARDALARLETLILMAGMDLPLSAAREQISSAIDIVVQQSRFACGARKITSIAEVTGMEGGRVQMQELFRFERIGLENGRTLGRFRGCDTVPGFYEELRAMGVAVDLSIFDREAA